MKVYAKLLNVSNIFRSSFHKYYSNLVAKELEVPTFCDVYITVPYSIKIKPLNIHKYHNCDKLIIEHNGNLEHSLECSINGNRVTLFDKNEDRDIECSVKLPIKANVYVNSKKNITVGQLNGDKIKLNSEEGNITLDKFHGECVKLITKKGNILLKNVIQASRIEAIITESGSIHGGRLQGLDLQLKTNEGHIAVESSYCNQSLFTVQKGNMDLSNIHKSCQIVLNEGQLTLHGFDGKLNTFIKSGCADIHLSRITENSDINIAKGSLHLKLAELCQEHVKFVVTAKNFDCTKDLKYIQRDDDGCVIINPGTNGDPSVTVNCLEGSVVMCSATWEDMIKIKLKK